jgi:hypothetical protein
MGRQAEASTEAALAVALTAYLDRRGERVAEVLWAGAIVLLRQALEDAERDDWGRWRSMPRRHLRVLRTQLAAGLELARLATAMQEDENERFRALTEGPRRERERAELLERKYVSRQALYVKRLRARCREEGREPTWDEIHAAQDQAALDVGLPVDDDLVDELHQAVRRAAG